MPYPKPLKWILIVLAWSSLAAAAVYFLSQRWELPKEDVRTGLLTRPVGSDKDALQVRAWISSNKAEVGQIVPFWISFTNASRAPITDLRFVTFEPAGFGLHGKGWVNGFPACLEMGSNGPLPARLDGGQGVAASAQLKAGQRPGVYAPAAVFSWKNDLGVESRQVISVGPVEIIDSSRERFLNAARRIKEIAIPIVLGVVGYVLQKASQRYTERSQVWQSQLNQNLNDAQKYYMPLLSPLIRLEMNLKGAESGDPQARQESLFSILLFLSRMRFLATSIGGIQFRNREGEAVVSYAWTALREFIEARLNYDDLELVLRHFDHHEDFHTFNGRFVRKHQRPLKRAFAGVRGIFSQVPDDESEEANVALSRVRNRFAKWLTDRSQPFANVMPLLDLISLTTNFEINRVFETWYAEKEPFPKSLLRQAGTRLERLPETDTLRALTDRIGKYLKAR